MRRADDRGRRAVLLLGNELLLRENELLLRDNELLLRGHEAWLYGIELAARAAGNAGRRRQATLVDAWSVAEATLFEALESLEATAGAPAAALGYGRASRQAKHARQV